MKRLVAVVFIVVAIATSCSSSQDESKQATTQSTTQSTSQSVLPLRDVFTRRTIEVTTPNATRKQPCAWLASTETQRSRGLSLISEADMNVDGADALMAFSWSTPETVGFWMKDTRFPISLAWVDENGRVLSVIEMPVCTDTCPVSTSPAPVRLVLEAPKGGLEKWGIVPGANIALGTSC